MKFLSQGMAHRNGNEASVPTSKGAWFTTGIQEIVGFWNLSFLEWAGCPPLGGELLRATHQSNLAWLKLKHQNSDAEVLRVPPPGGELL